MIMQHTTRIIRHDAPAYGAKSYRRERDLPGLLGWPINGFLATPRPVAMNRTRNTMEIIASEIILLALHRRRGRVLRTLSPHSKLVHDLNVAIEAEMQMREWLTNTRPVVGLQ